MQINDRRQSKLRQHKRLMVHQQGSIYSMLLVGVMFGLVLLTGLKLIPSYIDNQTISKSMATLSETDALQSMSIKEIRQSITRTLITNGIRDFDDKSILLTREKGREYIDVNYEKRIPIAYNVDAILTFNERFDK